jgi:hypothetical protein
MISGGTQGRTSLRAREIFQSPFIVNRAEIGSLIQILLPALNLRTY